MSKHKYWKAEIKENVTGESVAIVIDFVQDGNGYQRLPKQKKEKKEEKKEKKERKKRKERKKKRKKTVCT